MGQYEIQLYRALLEGHPGFIQGLELNMTALYMTSTNTGCENMEAKNAKVMAITHVDFMNQDNSVNGGDSVKEPDDGEPDDGEEVTKMHAHRVY